MVIRHLTDSFGTVRPRDFMDKAKTSDGRYTCSLVTITARVRFMTALPRVTRRTSPALPSSLSDFESILYEDL